jgi:hypothetical protein
MQPVKADYRALLALMIFIAGVLVCGALLAPPLFFAAQHYIEGAPGTATAKLLASKEFPSFFSRACTFVALIGIYPLVRSLRISWSSIVGDVSVRPGVLQLSKGMALALAGIFIMAVVCLKAGSCRMRGDPAWSSWLMPVLSGLSVATLEELLFRGAILGILCHSLGRRAGLWWTTGVFAIVHFLKTPADGGIAAADVTWTSGFWVISQLFRGFSAWNNFVGEFLLLVAVGWALGQARLKTNGLWLSVGLHAGWVAGMKYFGLIVKTTPALREGTLTPWMIANTCRAIVSPIVGIVPTIAVIATALLALWIVRSPQKAIASTAK